MVRVNPLTPELTRAATQDVATRGIVGKDDFLKLLITQFRNQDPLSPVESQEFAAQLAQFSSLEQLQNMNTSLNRSLTADQILATSVNNVLAATLIGREVRADGNTFTLAEPLQKVKLSYTLPVAANSVKIHVLDQNGVSVDTLDLGSSTMGEHTVEWDPVGKGRSGRWYSFIVEATGADGTPVEATTYIVGRITGVGYYEDGSTLILGGREVPFDRVRRISGV
jgi:flagellar basal-body rod modification protein FlgD